jgi:hypothetical protein
LIIAAISAEENRRERQAANDEAESGARHKVQNGTEIRRPHRRENDWHHGEKRHL